MEKTLPLPLPTFLRNLILTLVMNPNNSIFLLIPKYKLLQTIRFVVITSYFFFLRYIPSVFSHTTHHKFQHDTRLPPNDTAIGRALSQLLSTLNDIPVSSTKYQLVRSLADAIIHENHQSGLPALREVNRLVMSGAFAGALRQLEVTAAEREDQGEPDCYGLRLRRVVRAVRGRMTGGEPNLSGIPTEKLAAELVWLAQKMAVCGCADEAVRRWAAASRLGRLALTADPRLQTTLVKLAAFLFKEAKDLGLDEMEGSKMKLHVQVKLKMLQSWLPLLCRASNGTDAPALSISERVELERVLEDIIEGLEQEGQEQALSLWLHHFTHCQSSDWPNLHACYARWCSASRKQLVLE